MIRTLIKSKAATISILFPVAVCVLLLCTSCTRSANENGARVLAKVNGEPVNLDEFAMNLKQLRAEHDKISQDNPKVLKQLKGRALNEVIVMTMLRQEAAKRQIRIAPAEVEGRLANWKEGYPPGGFEEMLRKQNTTEEYLKKRIADQLLIEKVTEALFSNETLVSDEEMKSYYSEHQDEFFRPVRVHAFQIVVPTKGEAEKIRAEILSSQMTFESAARKYSLSPDAARGGDLGFFARNEKIAAFNAAFSLVVGTLSQPVQSSYGVHLLKVVEKEPSKKLALTEARDEIIKALKRAKEVKVYKEWVTKLLKDGEIYKNVAVFDTFS